MNYDEDSTADVDLNIAGDGRGGIVEIQGTAEGEMYSAQDLQKMTELGLKGIAALVEAQKEALKRADCNLDDLIEFREELNR